MAQEEVQMRKHAVTLRLSLTAQKPHQQGRGLAKWSCQLCCPVNTGVYINALLFLSSLQGALMRPRSSPTADPAAQKLPDSKNKIKATSCPGTGSMYNVPRLSE
jgi:hypothetical protein